MFLLNPTIASRYRLEDGGLFFRYWGKARPPEENTQDRYHPLVYHCLDVAACGWVLLSDDYPWVKPLTQGLAIAPDPLRRLFTFFLSLHDMGKFARAFQGIVTGLSDHLVPAEPRMPYTVRHDSLGFWLWKEADELHASLASFLAMSVRDVKVNSQLDSWFGIVTGHHGQPPRCQSQLLESHFTAEDMKAACAWVNEMLSLWLRPEDKEWLNDKTLRQKLKNHSWSLAGLTVIADWCGSNQSDFPYITQTMPLTTYWKDHALPNARRALSQIGLQSARVRPFSSLPHLFPQIIKPTPLQQYALQQPLCSAPQLFILEDVTGAGKTEAAMVLAHRLMSQGLATGLYIGLPTMATANAMYQRIVDCYFQLYQPDKPASLVLAHGARHLSDTFMQSVAHQAHDASYQQSELSASAYCNRWLADSRKKALLADVGVGTLDQALLAVLPARYQSLRLVGLSTKVLLVDEVHAYDPYMSTLLAAVLEMHARQGGSAILLSATLPQQMKARLLEAYARGRDQKAPLLNSMEYPLATQWSEHTTAQETAVATRPAIKRQVNIQGLADLEAVYQCIQKAVTAGQCVCWIRNTVDEARQSYQQLHHDLAHQAAGIHLFHSRFAMVDRQRIENDVLARFGKSSTAGQRLAQVLVATQVVEQSLDLDFDVLITDLAPVDLMLQRAGRLHRHCRDAYGNPLTGDNPDSREAPILYVLAPKPTEQADQHWLDALHGTLAVYQDLGQLWRSAKVLLERSHYSMPEDARVLIESVYAEDTPIATPEAIESASMPADGKRRAQVDMALFNGLKLDAGYSEKSNQSGWNEDVNIPTRLSDKTVAVLLLKPNEAGDWLPYADHPCCAWDLSVINLPERLWNRAKQGISPEREQQIEALRSQTPILTWYALLPLVDELAQWYHPQQGWLGDKGEKA